LQPGVRLYAAPLLGSTGPMDEKGCFRFKGAGVDGLRGATPSDEQGRRAM
jgi:hypothetical protein